MKAWASFYQARDVYITVLSYFDAQLLLKICFLCFFLSKQLAYFYYNIFNIMTYIIRQCSKGSKNKSVKAICGRAKDTSQKSIQSKFIFFDGNTIKKTGFSDAIWIGAFVFWRFSTLPFILGHILYYDVFYTMAFFMQLHIFIIILRRHCTMILSWTELILHAHMVGLDLRNSHIWGDYSTTELIIFPKFIKLNIE